VGVLQQGLAVTPGSAVVFMIRILLTWLRGNDYCIEQSCGAIRGEIGENSASNGSLERRYPLAAKWPW
jgi:hypothetical protein